MFTGCASSAWPGNLESTATDEEEVTTLAPPANTDGSQVACHVSTGPKHTASTLS